MQDRWVDEGLAFSLTGYDTACYNHTTRTTHALLRSQNGLLAAWHEPADADHPPGG